MTPARLAFAAFLAACFAPQANAAPGDANGNGGETPKHVSALACKGAVCRLTVKVEGDCTISVEPEWLFVSGKNVRLVWDILPAGYYFHPTEGIRFKDDYNPTWRSQFFEVGRGEGDFLSTDAPRSGPARQSTWADLNTQSGSSFRYSVTVINARTNTECRADPGVVNDW
jgi:hypothetical protein